MLNALKSLFASRDRSDAAHPAAGPEELQISACALLLEVAYADQDFTPDERQHIEEVVMRHFDLDEQSARKLMAIADEARRQSVDLHQFTTVITQRYDEGQRMVLAELIWRVVYADGKLSEHEGLLARKLAGLLDLRPGYLAEARRRVRNDAPDGAPGNR